LPLRPPGHDRYLEVVTASALVPGIIAAIQTFGDRSNLPLHLPFLVTEEEPKPVPLKGWAERIRKVNDVDSTVCPKCGGTMKSITFIAEFGAVDRMIDRLKLTFAAAKPPPCYVFEQVALSATEENADYFSSSHFHL